MPWHVRFQQQSQMQRLMGGHATACPYKSYTVFSIVNRDNLISSATCRKILTSSRSQLYYA